MLTDSASLLLLPLLKVNEKMLAVLHHEGDLFGWLSRVQGEDEGCGGVRKANTIGINHYQFSVTIFQARSLLSAIACEPATSRRKLENSSIYRNY